MADEAFIRQIFETFQLVFEPCGHLLVDPRSGRKQADHDHFAGALTNRPAKKTGVTFVKNIHNPVIVDVFSAFADFVSAGRTKADLFGDRLITFGTESHNFLL